MCLGCKYNDRDIKVYNEVWIFYGKVGEGIKDVFCRSCGF